MRREPIIKNTVHSICIAALLVGLQTGCFKKPATTQPLSVRSELYNLAITEISYHPVDAQGNNADQYEFIEIKDTGSVDVDLTDVLMRGAPDYDFPANTIIKAKSFIIIASNPVEFKNRYGFDPLGQFSGKLSNSEDNIYLEDVRADKAKFLSITYKTGSGWPQTADGDGNSLVPSGAGSDPNSAVYWRASFNKGGSPGKDDPGVVYISEILPHTDPPDTDAIELYNPNNVAVDIGNWYLTDSKLNPAMFRIPAGTTIAAKGFMVFTASSFNADPASKTSFGLSEHGDQVYLFSDSMGASAAGSGYYDGYTFGENDNGVSYGPYVNSVGVRDFVAFKEKTLGRPNSAPSVGPVVISEIMYHPKISIEEYIEVTNTSGAEVPLYDSKVPGNRWKIGGIDFTFPANLSIKPNEKIVIYSDVVTEAQFRSDYGVDAGVRVYGKAMSLSNAGDSLAIMRPADPFVDSTKTGKPTVNPYVVVERVSYTDATKWHSGADGTGQSLQRIKPDEYANDPASWNAGTPSPGK
jgi:hypothetical protein